ncbi:sensor histidine kinase [Roseimaritima ulvae]|uniref:histidine kinase n=1 Tax=Roseimaritima ulvae TaxID=980254 RepID=A0A5B9QM65_9BACT|nr:HAMP domain-containing sensor histidine kinase [Roseimaritima ulvae]QEG38720.1 putative sensor histidine kinase TcrY [Roseimaritima ulvae]
MKRWATVAACVVLAIGLAVMLGWHLQQVRLVHMYLSSVPMQYNAALGFVLLGAALCGVFSQWRWVPLTAAGTLLILASLTLLQYLLGISLAIDQALMDHSLVVDVPDPGRMAPNTAVCFVLMGAAIVCTSLGNSASCSATAAIIAALAFSLALVAFVGYLMAMPTAYGWGQLTRMALHTAVAFLLASSALVAWHWQRAEQPLPVWLPTLVAIAAMTTSVLFGQSLLAQQDEQLRANATGFQITLNHRMLDLQKALERMAGRLQRDELGVAERLWRHDADLYRRHFPEIKGLAILAANGQPVHSSPPQHRARATEDCCGRPLSIAHPMAASDINAEGEFLLVLAVVQDDQKSFSQLVATCDFQRFLQGTPALLEHFDVQWGTAADGTPSGFQRMLQLANASYRLRLRPLPGQGQNRAAVVMVLLAGFAVSGLLYWLVTSRQKVSQTMQTLQVYASSLDRSNQELQQFAYVAAHDLRSPLRGLTHLTRFIREDVADAGGTLPDSLQQYMAELDAQVQRMQGLLSGLLDYSRVGRDDQPATQVDLCKLVDDAIAMADVPAGFCVTKPEHYPTLQTRPDALARVLQNLIDNAVKHHDKSSGRIVIDVKERPQHVWLRIADDGPGIPAGARAKVFQIFQTLQPKSKSKTANSGIGLAIVRKLVVDAGGTIEIQDSHWGGAEFHIFWPKKLAQRVGPVGSKVP